MSMTAAQLLACAAIIATAADTRQMPHWRRLADALTAEAERQHQPTGEDQ